MIRIYGHEAGEASFTQVTRGMKRAVEAANAFAGFMPIDREFEGLKYDGATAPVALNLGSPQGVIAAHRYGKHQKHWFLLAPNGETIPMGVIQLLSTRSAALPNGLVDGLLAPSAWAVSVLERSFPGIPVLLAPHGITPGVHVVQEESRASMLSLFQKGTFRVLHLTSTASERKGTPQLLAAWRSWKEKKRPGELMIVAQEPNEHRWMASEAGMDDLSAWQVFLTKGLQWNMLSLAGLLSLAHVLCQPSRGEGFGLTGIEALAIGVPIVATACTGHSEWAKPGTPGLVIVPHGEIQPMNDFPGALAPEVTPASIEAALEHAFECYPQLHAEAIDHAPRIQSDWAWEVKNRAAIEAMVGSAMT